MYHHYSSSSRNKSKDPPLSTSHRSSPSISPSSSTFASSTSSSFSSRSSMSSAFFARAVSPTRTNPYGHHHQLHNTAAAHSSSSSSSVHFSFDRHRSTSPGRSSISFARQRTAASANAVPFNQKRTCACSPTTHPGSFRCALHRGLAIGNSRQTTSYRNSSCSGRLSFDYRRSAMKNSLVRIGGVEGELVKRALAALIRPSSHHQRRRAGFEPRPSRLSKMSKAEDNS